MSVFRSTPVFMYVCIYTYIHKYVCLSLSFSPPRVLSCGRWAFQSPFLSLFLFCSFCIYLPIKISLSFFLFFFSLSLSLSLSLRPSFLPLSHNLSLFLCHSSSFSFGLPSFWWGWFGSVKMFSGRGDGFILFSMEGSV